jgi:DNA-binding NarL/FixJ family response regulator
MDGPRGNNGMSTSRQSTQHSLPNDGPQVLTEREQAVARLVGHGYTNKEIADRLYVSAKTVEFHLSNIFAKLNIGNRRHLRDLARSW